MPKVVINGCFGGFGLSPDALQWLHDHGAKVACPVEEYFRGEDGLASALADWRTFRNTGKGAFCLTVFSPDEKFVLNASDIRRDDPLLVAAVEALGDKADGDYASLSVVDVPDDVKWHIQEYDGSEHVAEDHRTWG